MLCAPGEAPIAKKDSFCLATLKLGGLAPREYSAKIAWESKSEEERANLIAMTKKYRFLSGHTDEIGSAGVGVCVSG